MTIDLERLRELPNRGGWELEDWQAVFAAVKAVAAAPKEWRCERGETPTQGRCQEQRHVGCGWVVSIPIDEVAARDDR